MKVFFDHKIFIQQKIGGPSRYFVDLVENLNLMKNINAKIFAPLHLNDFLSITSRDSIGFEKKIVKSKRINQSLILKKQLMKFNDFSNKFFFKNFKPDIFHTTYYSENYKINHNKIVVTVFDLIHEIFHDYYNQNKNFLPKKNILEKSSHIICISESTKKDLINFYNIDPSKISVTYLATNFKKLNLNFINKKEIDYQYFLYVGSRWKYKNFKKLLEVFHYNSHILKNYKIILFGGGNLDDNEINLIEKFNLDKKQIIQINGDEKTLKSLYANAKFFIYPSKYEGFGLPILESFSQECPVLCSNTSSIPEVAGDAAIYFDPNDTVSISNSIEKILASDQIRQFYINKGKERLNFFSWNKCAMETFKIYEKLN